MSYFSSTYKFLSRNKLYTIVNIVGLSVALMFVILLADYSYSTATVDKFQKNGDRIYMLCNENSSGSAWGIQPHLLSRYPEIERTSAFICSTREVKVGENKMRAKCACVDSSFFDMFIIKMLDGDAKQAFTGKKNIIISKSFAAKAFGKESPVGRTLKFDGGGFSGEDFTIAGVFDDIRNSVLPNADLFADFSVANSFNYSLMTAEMNNAGGALVFVMAKKGADIKAKEADMLEYFKTFFWIYSREWAKKVNLMPLHEVFFNTNEDAQYTELNNGSRKMMDLMTALAAIILLFAVANYVSLSVAQSGFRAKEMATRRLVGASKESIFRRMILEAVAMTAVAFIIGFLLSIAAQPEANKLLNSDIDVVKDLDGVHILAYVLIVALTGVLAGIIPAAVISSSKPIEIVRGTLRRKTNATYGKILVTVQNVISIAMLSCALIMSSQTKHLINAPLGYNTKDVLDIYLWQHKFSDQVAFKKAVDELPCVEMTAFGCGNPADGGNNSTVECLDHDVSFRVLKGDDNYFKMLDIKCPDGSYPPASPQSRYFNDYALKQTGTAKDAPEMRLGKNHEWSWKSAGEIKDFQVWNITREKTAIAVQNYGDFERVLADTTMKSIESPWEILIKTKGDHKAAYAQVGAAYKKTFGLEMDDAKYLDQIIGDQFENEKKVAKMVNIFSAIAMLISALGLLAISTYYIRQRRKDIAVRKVIGATSSEETGRIVGSYMILVAVAFLIACPTAWYFMTKWLQNYSYRISPSPLTFIAAGLACALIAFLAIFFQTRAAANENPINSLNRQ